MVSRKSIIQKLKNSKKLIAAVYPIYYPKELFKAFDVHPFEVWGPPAISDKSGSAHLQSYICSIVKNGLSFLLDRGLEVADIIVIPHCCDSLQGFGSIVKDFINIEKPVITFYLPRNNRKVDIEFLATEFENIYKKLSKITGKKPSYEDLLNSINLEEKIDEILLKVNDYNILRLREFLPDEDFIRLIEDSLSKGKIKKDEKVPIIISGIIPEPKEILNIIEEAGGYIAADDLACIRRRIYPKGKSKNPFIRMAERILNGPPCPMKNSSIRDRINFLANLVNKTKAKGIIFYNIKFCEAENFYHPFIINYFKEIGISCLKVEVDLNSSISAQIITRIRAFIEMLKGV